MHKHHFSSTSAVPEELVSDNGPQFSAEEFNKFAREYGFLHKPCSPKFPQVNGEAERAVKTVRGGSRIREGGGHIEAERLKFGN